MNTVLDCESKSLTSCFIFSETLEISLERVAGFLLFILHQCDALWLADLASQKKLSIILNMLKSVADQTLF